MGLAGKMNCTGRFGSFTMVTASRYPQGPDLLSCMLRSGAQIRSSARPDSATGARRRSFAPLFALLQRAGPNELEQL
jgi:hypothetical protein